MRRFKDNEVGTLREFYALFLKWEGADISLEIETRIFRDEKGSQVTTNRLWYVCTFTSPEEKNRIQSLFYENDMKEKEDAHKDLIRQRKAIWKKHKENDDGGKK